MRDLSKTLLVAALLSATTCGALAAPAAKGPSPAAATGSPAAAPKATPPATPAEGDERCLLAMALLTRDKQNAQAASLAMVYYAGRLSARGIEVPAALKVAQTKVAPPQIGAEIQRCGAAFQITMKSLQQTFAPPPGAQPPPSAAPGPLASPPPAAPAPAPAAPAPK